MQRDAEHLPALVRGCTLASVCRDLERWRNDPARTWRIHSFFAYAPTTAADPLVRPRRRCP
jgi:hypothetical protein